MKCLNRIKRLGMILLFLAIFSILFSFSSNIFRKKFNGASDMVHSFYDIEKDSLDILFVGSSHAYYGISVNEIWERSGLASYVMGSAAQSPILTYYLIREALKYQKPHAICLETYGFCYNEWDLSERYLRRATDPLKFGRNKLEMLQVLCKDMTFKEKTSYYIPFIKYHDRWSDLGSEDFQTVPSYLKGCRLINGKRIYEQNTTKVEEEIPIIEESQVYLEKIVSLCKENNVELVLWSVPMTDYDAKKYVNYYGKNLYMEHWAKENGVTYFFMEKEGMKNPLDMENDFNDYSHVNLWGQQKVSIEFADYIAERYHLEGHKDDPAYADWNRCCERYMARRDELIEEAADGSNVIKKDTTGEEE